MPPSDPEKSFRPAHVTKPEDKVPIHSKMAYGTGMAADRLQSGTLNQMANPIFNDVLGIDPRLIGLTMGFSRVFDAVIDPIIGHLTDRTRSRFGRRRPWIAASSVFCAAAFAAVWMFPRGMSDQFYLVWFFASSILLYLCLSVFAVPYTALGMEMTPDYHERTSVMAYRTAMAKMGGFLISSLFFVVNLDYFDDIAEGMRYTGFGIAGIIFLFILAPFFFAREHPAFLESKAARRPKSNLLQSAKLTLSHKPFLILCGSTFSMMFGLTMVLSVAYYVITYHIFGGVKSLQTGLILTITGYSGQIGGLAGVPVMAYVSRRIGKYRTIRYALALAFAGTLVKWVCFDPANPYLTVIPGFSLAFAFAAIWTLTHAMIPDIIDVDELQTGERREGMFGAIYGISSKIGMSFGFLLSGFVINSSGFDAALGPAQTARTIVLLRAYDAFIPAAVIAIGFTLISLYPLSEDRSYEIRAALEKRRRAKAAPEDTPPA